MNMNKLEKLEKIESLVKDWKKELNEIKDQMKYEWEKGAFDMLECVIQKLEDILND